MWSFIAPAFRITLVLTVLTGLVYPAAVTGAAQLLFPHQAHGSLIVVNGRIVGSELIGQNFAQPRYFHPRPSAAGKDGYDAAASSGSNDGPTSRKLVARVQASVAQYRRDNPDFTGAIPADAVTASGSGLDPHISPANAEIQAVRVARARGLEVAVVKKIIRQHTNAPWLGFVGEPRVNVLGLNLALDREVGQR